MGIFDEFKRLAHPYEDEDEDDASENGGEFDTGEDGDAESEDE